MCLCHNVSAYACVRVNTRAKMCAVVCFLAERKICTHHHSVDFASWGYSRDTVAFAIDCHCRYCISSVKHFGSVPIRSPLFWCTCRQILCICSTLHAQHELYRLTLWSARHKNVLITASACYLLGRFYFLHFFLFSFNSQLYNLWRFNEPALQCVVAFLAWRTPSKYQFMHNNISDIEVKFISGRNFLFVSRIFTCSLCASWFVVWLSSMKPTAP